jgi:hypothetical protein
VPSKAPCGGASDVLDTTFRVSPWCALQNKGACDWPFNQPLPSMSLMLSRFCAAVPTCAVRTATALPPADTASSGCVCSPCSDFWCNCHWISTLL